MDPSSEHSEAAPVDDGTYEDVYPAARSAAAGAPAPPLFSREATMRSSNGKQRAGIESSRPKNAGRGYVYSFTRVTDVIYGQVGTQKTSLSSGSLPKRTSRTYLPPPLHPRTISMRDLPEDAVTESNREKLETIPEKSITPNGESSTPLGSSLSKQVAIPEICISHPSKPIPPPKPAGIEVHSKGSHKHSTPSKSPEIHSKGSHNCKTTLISSKPPKPQVPSKPLEQEVRSRKTIQTSSKPDGPSKLPEQEVCGKGSHDSRTSSTPPNPEVSSKPDVLSKQDKGSQKSETTSKPDVHGKGSHNYKTTVIHAGPEKAVMSVMPSSSISLDSKGARNLSPEEEMPKTGPSTDNGGARHEGEGVLHRANPICGACDEEMKQNSKALVVRDSFSEPTQGSANNVTDDHNNLRGIIAIPDVQKAVSDSSEKGDMVVLSTLQSHTPNKPDVPEKPATISTHPKVVKMRRLKKLIELQNVEEIYDSMESECSGVEEIYTDSAALEDLPGIATGLFSGAVEETLTEDFYLKPQSIGHKEVKGSKENTKPVESDNDSTDYEDLVLYEELASNQDDGYQDIEKARAEALGLPENIRHRVVRIVKGRQRRRLKRSIKVKSASLAKNYTLAKKEGESGSESPRPTVTRSDDNTPSSTGKEGSISGELRATTHTPDNSSSEDDTHDGSMSHDKARQVLDMLLEANNVKKIADISKSQSVQERRVSRKLIKQTKLDISLSPNLVKYQKDGILHARSQTEIAAEIRFLTDSAPKEPPPLPGIQRSRAKVVTPSDDIIRKHKLKKTNTFPRYNSS